MKQKCDRDCFHCIYDDCIEDGMTLEDYRASRELQEYIDPELVKRRKHSAAAMRKYRATMRKYRETHKAERAAYHAKYYAEHREEFLAYRAAYYQAHKAEAAAYNATFMPKYYANLQQRFSGFGRRIRDARSAAGYTQSTLAEALGCSQGTVAHLEAGRADPARWPRLFGLLPELREEAGD